MQPLRSFRPYGNTAAKATKAANGMYRPLVKPHLRDCLPRRVTMP